MEENNAEKKEIINKEAAKEKVTEVKEKTKEQATKFKAKFKEDKSFRNLTILVGGASLFVIIAIIIFIVIMPSPKKTVNKLCKGIVKGNVDTIVSLVHPDIIDKYEDYGTDFEDSVDDFFDNLEDNDYKVLSYQIDNDFDEIDDDDLEDLAEALDSMFGIREKSVQAAREYNVKFKVDDDGDKDTERSDIVVVKIDGRWYITSLPNIG